MNTELSARADELWEAGYSIPELWGFTRPVQRATSVVPGPHHLLWGILGMVEYQVRKGAGHDYLRDRLYSGDWLAIGRLAGDASGPLELIPRFETAKFGRKPSAIGDGRVKYVDARVLHARFIDMDVDRGA
jgi:hypothetical protein